MTPQLKCISISGKRYKKRLLITNNEVSILKKFINNTIQNEVLIVNSNFGLDIYYLSTNDYFKIIKNSFLLIALKNGKNVRDFKMKNLNSFSCFKDKFLCLSTMPIAFKCYVKNLFKQSKLTISTNLQIISKLYFIWHQVLLTMNTNEVNSLKLNEFNKALKNLIVKNQHQFILKELSSQAFEPIRSN